MMTREEIKAGLAYCKDDELCDECPVRDKCKADLLDQVYALVNQLEAQIPKFVSVKEQRPPQKTERYLCIITDLRHSWIEIVMYEWEEANEIGFWHAMGYLVTHWMPLPEPPNA